MNRLAYHSHCAFCDSFSSLGNTFAPSTDLSLELEFEQKLLFHKISYNSWALPLRLLHSPLQDNVTILLMILQSVLVFGKLEGQLDAWPWFSIFAPVWIFDVLFFVCCVIWFYFLAKSLLPKDYADVCLSGWLKDVLEAVQLAHSWFDYMLFAMASALSFLIFPLLLTLQLDVFSGLYFIGGGANAQLNSSLNSSAFLAGSSALLPSSLLSFRLSWSGIFASPTLASLIVLHMLHKRFAFCRRNRRYYRLGIALFLFIVTICSGVFTTLMGLHLDNYLPMWWSWWYTATPVWIAAGVGVVMLGGGFNLTQRTSWWRRLQNTPYSMTRAPLIGLLVIFIALLVHRGEVLALASRTPAPPPNSISNHLNINAQPSIHRMDASYPPASSISPSPSAPKISINSAKNGDISSKNSNSAPKNSATAQPASVVASLDPSFLFPFSFLFGLEAVLVLYWVQDLVDFGGHKSYTMRKQFNFSLSAHTDELEDNEPLVDPLDLLVQI